MDLSKAVFLGSIAVTALGGSFVYGALAYRSDLQPIPLMREAYRSVKEVLAPSERLLDVPELIHQAPIDTPLPAALAPGLVVVAGDLGERETAVRVIDRTGRILHEWRPVWGEVWPEDEGSFPERPARGMYLHGMAVLPDGSLVANFEHLSTFRMDVCGEIMWKLDNLGHHSVHAADDGTVWVASEIPIETGDTGYPFHVAPLRSWTMQQIGAEGAILRTIPVIDVLLQNDLAGLLYLSDLANETEVSGDTLHLNDVETFPRELPSEIFEPGDLMMSLRNINAVIVVDGETLEEKFVSVGRVMRHHDPDFIAGDRISVFDNRTHTLAKGAGPAHSRIVELDARTGALSTVIDGKDGAEPFFTHIMGMHARLDNGNILVVPSGEGRVLEFTPEGALAWRYDHRVAPDRNGRVYMADLLPETMDAAFFERMVAGCDASRDP